MQNEHWRRIDGGQHFFLKRTLQVNFYLTMTFYKFVVMKNILTLKVSSLVGLDGGNLVTFHQHLMNIPLEEELLPPSAVYN